MPVVLGVVGIDGIVEDEALATIGVADHLDVRFVRRQWPP